MVHTVLGAFVSILLLVVITWVAIFGGIGALLSRSRGGTVPAGLAWGSGLGPIGWVAILLTTRTDPLPDFAKCEESVPTTYLSSPPKAPTRSDRWDPWNK